MDIFNKHFTIWSSVTIAFEAGILLAISFMLIQRIWLAFGTQFGWNFTLDNILGINTLGFTFPGLVNSEMNGPSWITGGDFCMEDPIIQVLTSIEAS